MARQPSLPIQGATRRRPLGGRLACAVASVAYLCLGVGILTRLPLSSVRLALGLAGVCAVSVALAGLAVALGPEGDDVS